MLAAGTWEPDAEMAEPLDEGALVAVDNDEESDNEGVPWTDVSGVGIAKVEAEGAIVDMDAVGCVVDTVVAAADADGGCGCDDD